MSVNFIDRAHRRVGDLSILHRHIEVHANEDTLALQVEVRN